MVQKTRLEKTRKILEKASTIMDKLRMMAADDGMIDYDEIALIKVIEENMKEYQELLGVILEDYVVEDKELEQMKRLEREITKAVQEQAIADGDISVPERELVDALFNELRSFNSLDSF